MKVVLLFYQVLAVVLPMFVSPTSPPVGPKEVCAFTITTTKVRLWGLGCHQWGCTLRHHPMCKEKLVGY